MVSAGLKAHECGRDDGPAVLFVSYTADWRGPTLSLLHLLDHLGGRYRVGVALAGSGDFSRALEERGIPRFRFDRFDKWAIPRIVEIVRREGFDAVYANSTHGSARNAFLASALAGTPFVCHVRSMGRDKGWTRLGYLWFARAVIAVSDACAESVRRFVRQGRLHRVYNGVPLGVGDSGAERDERPGSRTRDRGLRDEVRAGANDTLLVSVAHLCRRKGQAEAVRAMPGILQRRPGAHLCLAGATDREPDYTAEVRELAADLGVAERVHLLGFRADVGEVLGEADVFVHTASADPHPRAVIEAMAAGLPVVAFAVDGVAETVVDGTTGRLVEPGERDELASAIAEVSGEATRMGAAARRRVEEHFTAEATARQVGDILDDVLRERTGPRVAT